MTNPRRREVVGDVVDSILKTRADKDKPATYYDKEEQERRLVSMFNKYDEMGGVWTDASYTVSVASTGKIKTLTL